MLNAYQLTTTPTSVHAVLVFMAMVSFVCRKLTASMFHLCAMKMDVVFPPNLDINAFAMPVNT